MKHFGFVMEQTLGHITHTRNLARWVEEDASVCPTWMPVMPEQSDVWERVPGVRSNWSLKASLRARDLLREQFKKRPLDAIFIHTQTAALFAVPFMRRVPTIVSLDATPLNYDTVGAEYGHNPGTNGLLERRKYEWNKRTFHACRALVTWCQWAKDSLVADYGVAPEKVTVIPPGVDMADWEFGREKAEAETTPDANRKLRLLFVGGDFQRKGGHVLAEAYSNGLSETCELDIVTKEAGVEDIVSGLSGVRVHRGLTANSAPLKELYARADLFAFPTLGDCLPIAVMEAMAAGLPVIATSVGALREEVEDGVNGLVVPPRDSAAIVAAVGALQSAPARTRTMARASRRMAEDRFNARRNYNAILDLMKQISDRNEGSIRGEAPAK